MKRSFFHSNFLTANGLVSTEDFLLKFAECSQFTFSAKDITTRKIFIHNPACAKLYGLEAQGLVGMSSRECLEQIKPFAGKEDALARWAKEDMKAIMSHAAQTKLITILDYAGFVRIREHLTIPVCNNSKKTVAIAAFCYDRTAYIDLINLFKQYQKHYPRPQALVQLSQYLSLDKFFQFRLTTGELYTLLALVQAHRHKQAAYLLTKFRQKAIAATTISGYVERLKDKLKSQVELETVLSHLRELNQWTPDLDTF